MAKKKASSASRFGARYGRSLKGKISLIEKKQKAKYSCPLCLKNKVKRVSYGIWLCTKCDTKFAGRAYSLKE
ncbi:MAG: 50S ribosomal protein L37ae [Candidatus Woesearchaeota archaeon]